MRGAVTTWKRCADLDCATGQHDGRIEGPARASTLVARCPMTSNNARVVSNFIVQALLGDDITIYGTARRREASATSTILSKAMTRLMATDDDFTGPINIGNPASSPSTISPPGSCS